MTIKVKNSCAHGIYCVWFAHVPREVEKPEIIEKFKEINQYYEEGTWEVDEEDLPYRVVPVKWLGV